MAHETHTCRLRYWLSRRRRDPGVHDPRPLRSDLDPLSRDARRSFCTAKGLKLDLLNVAISLFYIDFRSLLKKPSFDPSEV